MASRPFIFIICRASDSPVETTVKANFDELLPRLRTYWLDVSAGQIDISGSQVFEGVRLTKTLSELWTTERKDIAQEAILQAATLPGTPDFTKFFSIALVIVGWGEATNALTAPVTLFTSIWPPLPVSLRVMTIGSRHHNNDSIVAHEMGHNFGLVDSLDRHGIYRDPLDLMSAGVVHSFATPPATASGPGLNGVNLHKLGALPASRVQQRDVAGGPQTVRLQALAAPQRPGVSFLNLNHGPVNFGVEYRTSDRLDRGLPAPRGAVMIHYEHPNGHSVVERTPAGFDPYLQPGDVYDSRVEGIVDTPFVSPLGIPLPVRVEVIATDPVRREATVRYQTVSGGLTALNIANRRVLWRDVAGGTSLWTVDSKGAKLAEAKYGPFVGWRPLKYSDGQILWRNSGGAISLWAVNGAGNQTNYTESNPNRDGAEWVACDLSDQRVLWRSYTGGYALWKVDPSGARERSAEFALPNDWMIVNYSGNRLLLRDRTGRAQLWVLDSNGNKLSETNYGPFPNWAPVNYSGGRILWRHTSGSISLWIVDGAGSQTSYVQHGPFQNWHVVNYSDNQILWRHTNGAISIWEVDANGNQTAYTEHGPF